MPLFASPLATNVPSGTADILSYAILAVVAIFLASGPIITYYYWKKNKKAKVVSPTGRS